MDNLEKNTNTGDGNSGDWNSGNNNSGSGNIGDFNSGNFNSGNRNCGNFNIGNRNSSNRNSGNRNSGNGNSGNENSGSWNSGRHNSGNGNSGDGNSGDHNSGGGNSGNFNSGNFNSGDCNIGDFNIGEWNSASFSFGCFNTPDMPKRKISLFNKPSDWTWEDWIRSEAYEVMDYLKVSPVRWVDQEIMTEDEKKEHPEYAVTQGYLKTLSEEERISQRVKKWKALSDEQKRIIFSIPNFDKEIFKQITGIDVDNIEKNTNTGNGNSGNNNSGSGNSGNSNSGDFNSGKRNSGCWNSGDFNSGNFNSGDFNSGLWNSGSRNSGNCNTGVGNIGDCNSGDFNFANGSTGCFNTEDDRTISMFNKPTDWTRTDWYTSNARRIALEISAPFTTWITIDDMTEDEKQRHPDYIANKGYLKELSKEERFALHVKNWKALSDHEKCVILELPNFDKKIFKQITGIDVERD